LSNSATRLDSLPEGAGMTSSTRIFGADGSGGGSGDSAKATGATSRATSRATTSAAIRTLAPPLRPRFLMLAHGSKPPRSSREMPAQRRPRVDHQVGEHHQP